MKKKSATLSDKTTVVKHFFKEVIKTGKHDPSGGGGMLNSGFVPLMYLELYASNVDTHVYVTHMGVFSLKHGLVYP